MVRFILAVIGAAMISLSAGCTPHGLRHPERYAQGLVIILPGIEGRSPLNARLARGLAEGGVPSAVEIYDWSFGAPVAGLLINLADEPRNRRHARQIAQRIVDYQGAYPDRPVHLVGHSGGGGVAVYALEALPTEKPVTSALLLAPALSPQYDLRRALRRTRYGIWNFYSEHDVGFLRLGTSIFGTIDREHASAAGAVGFEEPRSLGAEGKEIYRTKLRQVRYTERMARSGHSGGHTGWASPQFAREWLAPLLYSQMGVEPTFAVSQNGSSGPAMGGGSGPSEPSGQEPPPKAPNGYSSRGAQNN